MSQVRKNQTCYVFKKRRPRVTQQSSRIARNIHFSEQLVCISTAKKKKKKKIYLNYYSMYLKTEVSYLGYLIKHKLHRSLKCAPLSLYTSSTHLKEGFKGSLRHLWNVKIQTSFGSSYYVQKFVQPPSPKFQC